MKTEDILLIGGIAAGAWYLWGKKAEAQPIQELLGGDGGGGGFDLSSLLAAMNLGQAKIPQLSLNLGDLGLGKQQGSGIPDLSSLLSGLSLGIYPGFSSGLSTGLSSIIEKLNLSGLGGAATDTMGSIIDKAKESVQSWTEPWSGITDPLHQANVNLAETGKGITGAVGAVTAVGRTAVGGFTNAITAQSPWYSYLFGPVGAVIGGMWTEAGEIVSEKNAAQGTVKLGPEALKTIQQYGGRAAVAEAAQQLAIAQQKGLTPQKQAAAQEVNLGKTTEGPSGLYSGYAQPAAVQKAKTINQRPTIISQKVNYIESGYA